MKKPIESTLTQERIKQLISYDCETGQIFWLSNENVHHKVRGKLATNKNNFGYGRIGVDGHTYQQHRIAWLYHYGEWPKQLIDHIDGNRLNNAISNLRDVSVKENLQNIHCHKGNKFGLLGVFAHGNRFRTQISSNGKSVHLGIFNTALEAHEAFIAAKRSAHKGFAS